MPFGFFKEIHVTDPGFGTGDGDIDNTLPGGGGHPWLPGHGRPSRPDNGLPSAPVRPDGSPILPPRPWPPLPWTPGANFPPSITDPDWGIEGGPPTHPSIPIFIPPDRIDNELPPVAGTKPPQNPPPGTIWPPIAGLPEGKVALLAWFYRAGWRYVVVDASLAPGTPLPTPPGTPSVPDNTLPSTPEPK